MCHIYTSTKFLGVVSFMLTYRGENEDPERYLSPVLVQGQFPLPRADWELCSTSWLGLAEDKLIGLDLLVDD
jgi:hypothetical protein